MTFNTALSCETVTITASSQARSNNEPSAQQKCTSQGGVAFSAVIVCEPGSSECETMVQCQMPCENLVSLSLD